MADHATSVAQLRQLVEEFVAERDWSQFHTPKNLAMALAIEAAELMEHFQWLTPDESWAVRDDPAKLHEVREELADVFGYCLAMASELGIDMADAVEQKMVKNREKYPVKEFKGRYSAEGVRPAADGGERSE